MILAYHFLIYFQPDFNLSLLTTPQSFETLWLKCADYNNFK